MKRKRSKREKRQDEIDSFLSLKTSEKAIWVFGPRTHQYHATTDGVRSLCPDRVLLDEKSDPYPGVYDRSVDRINEEIGHACAGCQFLVRRIVTDPERVKRQREHAVRLAARRAWEGLARLPAMRQCSSGRATQ